MNKIFVIMFFSLFTFLFSACTNDEIIGSEPIGYGLLSEDYVGSLTMSYDSQNPYNVNNFSIDSYYLPHLWAELDLDEEGEIGDLILTVELPATTKYYAKYLLVGSTTFTGELVIESSETKVRYYNHEQIDIMELLEDEEEAKWYIEQIESYQAFMTNENGATLEIKSIFDQESTQFPYQRVTQNKHMFSVNWIDSQDKLPQFPALNPGLQAEYGFDTELLNNLLQRAYDQRNNPEYIKTRIIN